MRMFLRFFVGRLAASCRGGPSAFTFASGLPPELLVLRVITESPLPLPVLLLNLFAFAREIDWRAFSFMILPPGSAEIPSMSHKKRFSRNGPVDHISAKVLWLR